MINLVCSPFDEFPALRFRRPQEDSGKVSPEVIRKFSPDSEEFICDMRDLSFPLFSKYPHTFITCHVRTRSGLFLHLDNRAFRTDINTGHAGLAILVYESLSILYDNCIKRAR